MASVKFTGGDRLKAVLNRLGVQATKASNVRIGFLEGSTYPSAGPGSPVLPVATVAFWNEFGTSTAPPRPFFRDMISQKSPGWGASMAKIAKSQGPDAEKILTAMGRGIQGQLQQSINAFSTPANAPSTIARKGFNKPLIETAVMLHSVDFEVDK